MTDTQQSVPSLPSFIWAESVTYIRRITGISIIVVMFALPALVFTLTWDPSAIGYLVIATSSLILIWTGLWDDAADAAENEDSEIEANSPHRQIYVMGVLYAVIGIPFAVLLSVSAVGGVILRDLGYPLAALAIAASLPYIDRRMSKIHAYLSVVSVSSLVVVSILNGLTILYSIPQEVIDEVDFYRRRYY